MTVIGLYARRRFQTFVRGKNLKDFPKAVARLRLLVSFGGAQFDMPFLQRTFPLFAPPPHVDLRFPLNRLGYSGGLKEIESDLDIKRPGNISHMNGFDAIHLWNRHQRGDRSALKLLIEYTRHDVLNLIPLAKAMSEGMRTRLGF
ncbi:MAG: ribonuclease H-like domain-containing protein [Deltaproteobacteria bacterium]